MIPAEATKEAVRTPSGLPLADRSVGCLLRALATRLWKDRYAYAFLAPGYLMFLCLVFMPLIAGIWVSFFATDFITFKWVGLGNYRLLASDADFLRVINNTVAYVGILVPATTVVSLLIAFVLDPLPRTMQSFFRAAFYLPGAIGGIVLTTVWLWIFDPTFGIANYVAALMGIKPVLWLASKAALYAVCIVAFFMNLGGNIILFAAGLANIPSEVKEAAKVDGAGRWRVIWHVELPLLRPVLGFVVATQTIAYFQIWETIYILTNGGPFNSSASVVFFIFQTAFRYSKWGLGAAMGVVLMIIIMVITLLQLRYWTIASPAES